VEQGGKLWKKGTVASSHPDLAYWEYSVYPNCWVWRVQTKNCSVARGGNKSIFKKGMGFVDFIDFFN